MIAMEIDLTKGISVHLQQTPKKNTSSVNGHRTRIAAQVSVPKQILFVNDRRDSVWQLIAITLPFNGNIIATIANKIATNGYKLLSNGHKCHKLQFNGH